MHPKKPTQFKAPIELSNQEAKLNRVSCVSDPRCGTSECVSSVAHVRLELFKSIPSFLCAPTPFLVFDLSRPSNTILLFVWTFDTHIVFSMVLRRLKQIIYRSDICECVGRLGLELQKSAPLFFVRVNCFHLSKAYHQAHGML